jgi:hypothetical protein
LESDHFDWYSLRDLGTIFGGLDALRRYYDEAL